MRVPSHERGDLRAEETEGSKEAEEEEELVLGAAEQQPETAEQRRPSAVYPAIRRFLLGGRVVTAVSVQGGLSDGDERRHLQEPIQFNLACDRIITVYRQNSEHSLIGSPVGRGSYVLKPAIFFFFLLWRVQS